MSDFQSEKLRILREQKGLTQEELAARAGVGSQSVVSRLENGPTTRPQKRTVKKLANALGCEVGDLMAEGAPQVLEKDSTPWELLGKVLKRNGGKIPGFSDAENLEAVALYFQNSELNPRYLSEYVEVPAGDKSHSIDLQEVLGSSPRLDFIARMAAEIDAQDRRSSQEKPQAA